MARLDRDQVIGPDGSVVSERIVERPELAVSYDAAEEARGTLKTMAATYDQGGKEPPVPTNAELRDWLLALTAQIRHMAGEMEDDEHGDRVM